MPTSTFTGYSTFDLKSVTQVSSTVVTVTFSRIPVASSSTGTFDALNPSNYTFTGPGSAVIQSIAIVSGDNFSVNVTFAGALAVGNWTLTVANIKGASPSLTLTTATANFTTTLIAATTDVNGGATANSVEDAIRKNLPPLFQGKHWDALIAAFAAGDSFKQQNNRDAAKAIHLATASGKWLKQRGSDVGISYPTNIGMDDELYRRLAIKVTANKLTVDALLEVLEIFYGTDAVRAYETAAVAEPYVITDGMQLIVTPDNNDSVYVTFKTADMAVPGAAKALELAEAINRQFRLQSIKAYAISYYNANDGLNYLRIYSGARGLRGSITVNGGQAQNILKFPTDLAVDCNGITWTITNPTPGTMRFAASSDPGLSAVRSGDYVTIYGTEFNSKNRGTYTVTNVVIASGSRYFELANTTGVVENVTQAATANLKFFRPTKSTIQNGLRTATVLQPSPSSLQVQIPATTQAVNREALSAAYLQGTAPVSISSASRDTTGLVTVVTSTNHGLSNGKLTFIDGLYPDTTTHVGIHRGGGGLNGLQTVTVLSPTSFTYSTPFFTSIIDNCLAGGTSTKVGATVNSNPIGPYIFDPDSGVGVTKSSSTLNQTIYANQQYHLLTVTDSTQFPDSPGYLCIAFGKSNQTSPIPYIGRGSSTQLILDYTFKFPYNISSGEKVILLSGKSPYLPTDPSTVGAFYVTGSNAGKATAESTIDLVCAEGMNKSVTIVYPGDRGLGAEGWPATGNKVSDKVAVWGSDNLDSEIADAHEE